MKPAGIIAGRLGKKQDQPLGYSAVELVRLVQEWDGKDTPLLTEEQADMLARFAVAVGELSGLLLYDKRILNMRLVKAIFSYGRHVGRNEHA